MKTSLQLAEYRELSGKLHFSFTVRRLHTHLSCIEWWVLRVVWEEEHVYEVDKYTGSLLGLGRAVGDPFEDHHEDQVAKQRDHEEQLRD